jgi:ABC-type lipoprotein release transport system permease subunit
VTVVQPEGDTVALVIPYDLRRRLEDLPAVAQVGQRVYGQVSAAPARAVTVPLRAHRAAAFAAATGGPAPADRCGAVAAGATGLAVGQRLVRAGTAPGDEGCPAYVVARVTATADASGAGLHVLRPDGDDDDAPAEGPMSLLAAEATTSLRFVGVEPAVEARLSALPGHLAAGAVLGETLPGAADEASWPVLLTERAARRLQVGVGASLLLSTRDAERRVGQHPAQVVGLLRDATWPADRPELVLPVFPAQQIDLPLLNARAHELVLVPRPGQDLTALARAAEAQFVPLVRPWQTITPDLAKMLATQDTMMVVLLVIIFAIAAITVMNTMLMAVYERTREFGVLKSLGMLPRQVFALIVVETLLVALFAILIGCSVGLGINHYLEVKGLDLTSITGGFTYQGAFIDPVWRAVLTARTLFLPPLLVTLVCLVVSFYPALRASRLKPVEAFRHTT